MKKLMLAIAAVTVAVVANAATVSWGANKGYLYDGATAVKVTSGDAYLMYVTAGYTQTDLVAAFNTANGDKTATLASMTASGALATGTGTIGDNARITGASTSDLAAADGSVYFVVFNDDKMYVSITATSEYDSVMGSSTATFASISASSKLDFQAADGYSAAGWYAVPEPTSGLLMLLGMAGLALRRKRA